jgi:hypothetical protein
MLDFYVYALCNPTKPFNKKVLNVYLQYEPFYIGKGKKKRLFDHTSADIHNPIKARTIAKIDRAGLQVERVKLKQGLSSEKANLLEIKLIAKLGRRCLKTGPLTNILSGGEGGRQSDKVIREQVKRMTKFHANKTQEEKDYFSKTCSDSRKKYHEGLSEEEKISRGKNISEGKINRTEKEKKKTSRRLSKGLKKYHENLTVEQKAINNIKLSNGHKNRSDLAKKELSDKRSKITSEIMGSLTPKQKALRQRNQSEGAKRKRAEETPEQRALRNQKISETKKLRFLEKQKLELTQLKIALNKSFEKRGIKKRYSV